MNSLATADRSAFAQDRPAYGPSRFPPERMKTIYAITERGGRSFYTRIGIGFVNKDDSITIKLEAFPTSGTLQVREYHRLEPADRGSSGGYGDDASNGRRDELSARPSLSSDPF